MAVFKLDILVVRSPEGQAALFVLWSQYQKRRRSESSLTNVQKEAKFSRQLFSKMPTYRDSKDKIKVLEEQNNTLRQENRLEKNSLRYLQKKLHIIEWKIYLRNKKEVSRGFITCYKLQ